MLSNFIASGSNAAYDIETQQVVVDDRTLKCEVDQSQPEISEVDQYQPEIRIKY
jgi:uncharacterized protein YcfL